MKLQVRNLWKSGVFNIGLAITWTKEVQFAALGLGFVSIFLYKPEKENDHDEKQ